LIVWSIYLYLSISVYICIYIYILVCNIDNAVRTLAKVRARYTRHGGLFPTRERDLSVLWNIQTGPGARWSSYSINTEGYSPEMKQPQRETKHSAPSSAEFKNKRSYTFPLRYAFMAPSVTLFTNCYKYISAVCQEVLLRFSGGLLSIKKMKTKKWTVRFCAEVSETQLLRYVVISRIRHITYVKCRCFLPRGARRRTGNILAVGTAHAQAWQSCNTESLVVENLHSSTVMFEF